MFPMKIILLLENRIYIALWTHLQKENGLTFNPFYLTPIGFTIQTWVRFEMDLRIEFWNKFSYRAQVSYQGQTNMFGII